MTSFRSALLACLLVAPLLPGAARAAGGVNCYATKAGATACTVDPSLNAAALCNDGTQPAFWYRPGAGAGATRWVFWFEGGDQCADQPTCATRAVKQPSLVTSNGFMPGQGQGLLSSSATMSPLLYNANIVFMHYCSSDTWAGARAPSVTTGFAGNDPNTWSFQGHAVANVQVQSVAELAPGLSQASEILIGGSSAGGVGATVNVNALLGLLPKLPAGKILFANDAGFALDVGQYEASYTKPPYAYTGHPNFFEMTLPAWLAFWNGSGDPACLAQQPAQTTNCYDTAYVLDNGYIALPSFVAESQLDQAQLHDEICPEGSAPSCKLSTNPKSKVGIYETYFATQMAQALTASGTPATFSFYAPDDLEHVILENNTAFTLSTAFPDGVHTAQKVFDGWLANPTGARITLLGNGPGVAPPGQPSHARFQ